MESKFYLGAVSGAVVILIGAILIGGAQKPASFGSVNIANEYQSTTTVPTGAVVNRSTLIDNRTGVLGSVIISSTTNATFVIKNATSSTDVASTTVAKFAESSANGTYTFDLNLTRGLILEIPAGFAGSYTITYR